MSSLRRDWNEFWFAPISSASLGLFRLMFGLLVFLYGLILFPDRWTWFSQTGVISNAVSNQYNQFATPGPRLNLFNDGIGDHTLTLFFIVFLLGALGLMLGLWTRLSTLIVFIGLNSLHNRCSVIDHSGDTVMMVMTGYLLLSPAGAACSLDRLWRVLRGREGDAAPCIVPWTQRLMQIQVTLVYLCTSLSKFHGPDWLTGIAIYYPLHLPESVRFPVPWMDGNHLWAINLMTYGTLGIELALGTLIWVPRLRLYILALGVMLHLGIEYAMNIPLFEFVMIASYLTFIRETDLQHFQAWIQEPLAVTRLQLVYDGECDFCKSALLIVRFLDVFRLITFLDYHAPEQLQLAPSVRYEDADQAAIAVDTKGRTHPGFYAFRTIAWRLPATWLLAPLGYLPGIPWLGRRVYAWVVANRSRLPIAPRYKVPKPKKAEQVLT